MKKPIVCAEMISIMDNCLLGLLFSEFLEPTQALTSTHVPFVNQMEVTLIINTAQNYAYVILCTLYKIEKIWF